YYPTIQFIGPELEEWNRSCYTFKSKSEFDDTEILGTGPTITNQDFENLIKAVQSSLEKVDYIALSGSWPKGSPENGYASIIKLCHQANKPTMLDCTGIQLSNALQVKPTAVHLNRKEITEFYGCDFNEAKSIILTSCEIAAITDGSKGLHLLNKDQSFHSLTKVDQVISTIGSGDCLTAGVVAGLAQAMSLQEVANLGAACGAANCLREDLGMLRKSDVEMLLMQLAH
ncbi:MAG: 1-phosphofructokinase, partial [Rickettsiales bacterium]|nr:1-phosphofructokinase [Rickettsiales bacterium]